MNWAKQVRQLGRFLRDLVAYSRRVKPTPVTPRPQPEHTTTPVGSSAVSFRVASEAEMKAIVLSGVCGKPEPHKGREWIERVCQFANDPTWGLHQRPNGKISTDILASNRHGYAIFDVIRAEETDAEPSWQGGVPIEAGSTFVPVVTEPETRLHRLTVSGTRFLADGKPFTWAGVTAFDLPVRLREGDTTYADWITARGFTLARIVPASVYRTRRSLADGVRDLPRALDALKDRGLYAEVVVFVDTKDYGLSLNEAWAYLRDISAICRAYPNAVVEIANENTHHTQQDYLRDGAMLAEFAASVGVTCSAGSTHGGEAPDWTQGTYLTHHADRDRTPEQNAVIMAEFQAITGKPVVDDESLGTKGAAQHNRTNDPGYGERQALAARARGLGGVTLHLDMGLDARFVDDAVQVESARRFVAAMKG